MIPDRPTLLAAIDRRLWRDLGFADPEPEILRFLPMLLVAWSDDRVSEGERERITERAAELPEPLRRWIAERLTFPPGPYFRYQVAHLLAFLHSVWPGDEEWVEEGEQWASELIEGAGWLRKLFGRVDKERRQLHHLHDVVQEAKILATDQIWALARGAHADFEPRHAAVVVEDDDQVLQGLAITLDGPGERISVGTRMVTVSDEDLPIDKVVERLARSAHLREPERWILVGGLVYGRGRQPTPRQAAEVDHALEAELGHPVEHVGLAELAYLEDALAVDARWMSWLPGRLEVLRIDRERVWRPQSPGCLDAPRSEVRATVGKHTLAGPPGLGFRVLHIESPQGELRLASPVILTEPASAPAVEWIARFLPALCDPCQQLQLDADGSRWVAEVTARMPTRCSSNPEPLLHGRSLLVPPWVWFRAAGALGVRYFAGKRPPGA